MGRERRRRRSSFASAGRRTAGVLAGLGMIGLALAVAGPADVARALLDATPGHVGVAAGFVALALLGWGVSLAAVLRSLGADVPVPRAAWLFLGTVFLNAVTPFGQAGGDPPSGLLLARGAGVRFEEGLAAITSVNTVNRLAGGFLGVLVAVVAGGGRLPATGSILAASVAGGALIVAAAALAWRGRDRVAAWTAAAVTPLARAVGRLLPGATAPTRDAVRARADGFVAAIERVATPRTGAVVVGLGMAGHLAVAAALRASLLAVGVEVPLAAAVVALPVARLAGVVPTPGGLGGVEVTLGGLLVAIAGVGAPEAGAAVLVYRGVAVWMPLVPGGIVAGSVLVGPSRS